MGGVYNVINLHVYHYAGNNPLKYTDPDGRFSFDEESGVFSSEYTDNADLVAALATKVKYDSENGTNTTMKIADGRMPVLSSNNNEDLAAYISNKVNATGGTTLEGVLGALGLPTSVIDAFCDVSGIQGNVASKIASGSIIMGIASLVVDGVTAFNDSNFENVMNVGIDIVSFAGPAGLFLGLSAKGAMKVAPYAAKGVYGLENSIMDFTAERSYGIPNFSKMVGR
jgi:hypothetical protein